MYVLGINGSPRAGGNSDLLLDEALRGAAARGARTEKLMLCRMSIAPCRECDEGGGDGECRRDDDMRIVYAKVREAGALIIASPVFFGSVTAQAKAMIDRFQCAWLARRRRGRDVFPGERACAFIAPAASAREDFFANARSVVRNLCATVNARYTEELFCPGLEEKGSVLRHPEMMKKAREMGGRLAARPLGRKQNCAHHEAHGGHEDH